MPAEYIRRTFTLTPQEIDMLRALTEARFGQEERVESLTLRQIIREAYELMQREQTKASKRS